VERIAEVDRPQAGGYNIYEITLAAISSTSDNAKMVFGKRVLGENLVVI